MYTVAHTMASIEVSSRIHMPNENDKATSQKNSDATTQNRGSPKERKLPNDPPPLLPSSFLRALRHYHVFFTQSVVKVITFCRRACALLRRPCHTAYLRMRSKQYDKHDQTELFAQDHNNPAVYMPKLCFMAETMTSGTQYITVHAN